MPKLDPLFPNQDDFFIRRIHSLDYNSIRAKIIAILGNGSGSTGYGQIISSSDVSSGNTITAEQWQNLRNDLVNIKLHQEGNVPTLAQIVQNSVIGFGESQPNREFDRIADEAFAARFNIGIGRSAVSAATSQTRTGSWTTQSQCEATATFPSSDDARYFFNSGGKIRFTSTRTGGSATSQNNAWSNVLNSAGTYQFSGNNTDIENFYTLTNTYRNVFVQILSTPYSANFYRIEAKCDVANNSTGTASIIDFRITWRDDYVDPDIVFGRPSDLHVLPGDVVDGTLSIVIEELKAIGSLVPTGSFTISSPVYSITPITAT